MDSASNETYSREAGSSQSNNERSNSQGQKRKWEHKDGKVQMQHGSKRSKGRDMGRQEYFRANIGKRERNERQQEKRKNGREDINSIPFTKEEIEADTRQPKRKVAVMLGYAGTGYKGMQMVPNQKTIEGDIFQAFVKAGAISKANADDPKKSTFVRCARTDKGVHAAGNVISLKLIIEDPDIIKKINDNLPDQIRIWGIERTVASFSCYQACDSRWYEYLIPTHSFLPPHPNSYLGQKLVELATEMGDLDGYNKRQEEVAGFWEAAEEQYIKPILEGLNPEVRAQVEQALYQLNDDSKALEDEEDEAEELADDNENAMAEAPVDESRDEAQTGEEKPLPEAVPSTTDLPVEEPLEQPVELRNAIKALKEAYLLAKRRWRIPEARLARVQEAFGQYKGTHNFHNYTVNKHFKDPSASRHIISFEVNPKPLIIGGTEWLSLKVHGQSFMMHQIRKMVGFASLVVRCGSNFDGLFKDSFQDKLFSIPKVPGLGLLLERPVFDSYNSKAAQKFERAGVSFEPYEKEMDDFKMKEIYQRIWDEEERDGVFNAFFSHVDNYRVPTFLYLSSKGLAACGESRIASEKREPSRRERQDRGKKRKQWQDGNRDKKDESPADEGANADQEGEKIDQDVGGSDKAVEAAGEADLEQQDQLSTRPPNSEGQEITANKES